MIVYGILTKLSSVPSLILGTPLVGTGFATLTAAKSSTLTASQGE